MNTNQTHKIERLGRRQRSTLRQLAQDGSWDLHRPDSETLKVLVSLQRRGWVDQDSTGEWTASPEAQVYYTGFYAISDEVQRIEDELEAKALHREGRWLG